MFSSAQHFPKIFLIGGLTGSGKTELLQHLSYAGGQVLNLESLCCHDGSAFARLQYAAQPTSYQFNKRLHKIWKTFSVDKPVFIEHELQRIGNLTIPDWLYRPMPSAPVIWLDTERAIRIERLSRLVRRSDALIFCECLQKLSDRLSESTIASVLKNFSEGNIERTVELLLDYYDNSNGYAIGVEKIILNLPVDKLDMQSYCKLVRDVEYNIA